MSAKHSHPWQTNQLESAKYIKPKSFNQIGPAQIRDAAYKKMMREKELYLN
jgi:hypothetical protein